MEALQPGKGGQFNFSVVVKNPPTKDSTKNLIVKFSPTIISTSQSTGFPGSDLTLKINSYFKPSASMAAIVATNVQVGETVSYKVTLQVKSGTNDLKDGQLTAFIPLSKGSVIESSFQSSEGTKLSFDAATSKLTWQFDSVPAFAGTFGNPLSATSTVNVKPSQVQKGNEITVLKDITAKATDTFTNKVFNGKIENLVTRSVE